MYNLSLRAQLLSFPEYFITASLSGVIFISTLPQRPTRFPLAKDGMHRQNKQTGELHCNSQEQALVLPPRILTNDHRPDLPYDSLPTPAPSASAPAEVVPLQGDSANIPRSNFPNESPSTPAHVASTPTAAFPPQRGLTNEHCRSLPNASPFTPASTARAEATPRPVPLTNEPRQNPRNYSPFTPAAGTPVEASPLPVRLANQPGTYLSDGASSTPTC